MEKGTLWKWLILVAALAFSLVIVTPPAEKIRLGLDLQGGTSFIVQIDEEQVRQDLQSGPETLTPEQIEAEVARVLEGAQMRTLEVIRNRVDNLGIEEPVIFPGQGNRIVVQLPGVDEQKRQTAKENIQSAAFLEFRLVHEDSVDLVDQLFEKRLVPEGYRIVDMGREQYYEKDKNFPDGQRDENYRERLARFNVPDAGHEFMLERNDVEGRVLYRPAFVKRRRELTGEFLEDASVDFQSLGQPMVKIRFDAKGARKFARITGDYAPGGARNPNPNQYRQLAIVLDDTLYSAPRINEAIFGGKAQITGSFTLAEANYLSNILRAGSLPAPVEIVEERFVSPSLGEDSIRSGVRAAAYGGIAVVVFMAIYYLSCGVIADVALILNMLLLPLGMIITSGFLGIFVREGARSTIIQLPVLTLPGIAGIALTIGMAVDANILIFERIREESATGKRLWSAITAGYDRAFVTILDSNITTLLTGVILFIFGSGPIRGFAVTLNAGILVSMFTALVVTRLLFRALVSATGMKQIKMLSVVREPKFDFIGKRKVVIAASLLIIVASWALLVTRGIKNPANVFGVDFTGGAAVTFTYRDKVPVEDIRAALAEGGLGEAHLQYQEQVETGGLSYFTVKTSSGVGQETRPADVAKDIVTSKFGTSGFTAISEDEVGPQVGRELKKQALWSIVLALVGMILYISWRFEFGFAIGALAALGHDVLFTVGIFCLMGRQINLPIVAAILTIVGYSINDTIVIFDRIREDLRIVRNLTFKDICNVSVNQTLSRTVLTAFTTLIMVGMLLIFGGGAVYDFALTLFIGIIVGTYSSIFVATPVVLAWYRGRRPEFSATTK